MDDRGPRIDPTSRRGRKHGCTKSTTRCISADVTCGYPRARERDSGQGRWPTARHSRDLCRLDVRKAAAGPRSTGAPSPRMRRAGRAAQRDDDTARRARPCACIRRYNPEEPPTPSPPRALLYLRHNRPTTHLFMAYNHPDLLRRPAQTTFPASASTEATGASKSALLVVC